MATIDRAIQELFKVTGKGISGLFAGWGSTVKTARKAATTVGARTGETNARTAHSLNNIANNDALNGVEKFGLTQARRLDGALEVGTDIVTDVVSGVAQVAASTVGAVVNTAAKVALGGAAVAAKGAWEVGSTVATLGGMAVVGAARGPIGKAAFYAGKSAVQIGGLTAKEAGKGAVDLGKLIYHTRNSRAVQMGTAALGIGVIFPAAAELGQHHAETEYKLGTNQQQISTNGGGTFIRDSKPPDVDMAADGNLVFALHNLRHGG
jgi:hypothetical protein